MRKMVIYYEHNAMWLAQDAKVYQVDTTKHKGTNVCLPHTCTHTQPAPNFLCGYPIQRDGNQTPAKTAWAWHSSLTKMQQCMNMFI